jgi:hypothetical protein
VRDQKGHLLDSHVPAMHDSIRQMSVSSSSLVQYAPLIEDALEEARRDTGSQGFVVACPYHAAKIQQWARSSLSTVAKGLVGLAGVGLAGLAGKKIYDKTFLDQDAARVQEMRKQLRQHFQTQKIKSDNAMMERVLHKLNTKKEVLYQAADALPCSYGDKSQCDRHGECQWVPQLQDCMDRSGRLTPQELDMLKRQNIPLEEDEVDYLDTASAEETRIKDLLDKIQAEDQPAREDLGMKEILEEFDSLGTEKQRKYWEHMSPQKAQWLYTTYKDLWGLSPPPDAPLPPGWRQLATQTGEAYWWHSDTGEIAHTRPVAAHPHTSQTSPF